MRLVQLAQMVEAAPYAAKNTILSRHGEHRFLETKEEIESQLHQWGITRFVIVKEGDHFVVDVTGDVKLEKKGLRYIPIQFRNVTGSFVINVNPDLETLKGCPMYVGKKFACAMNRKITSLEYGPKEVGGLYNARQCNLKNLVGAPEFVGGNFNVFGNELTTLEGGPKHVNGDYAVYHNRLTSLEHSPEFVGGNFNASNNKITSLEGIPKEIHGESIDLSDNKITSLKNVHKYIPVVGNGVGTLSIGGNPIKDSMLGLLLIKAAKARVTIGHGHDDTEKKRQANSRMVLAGQIINKHMHEKDTFACQNELLDNDLEEYAQT